MCTLSEGGKRSDVSLTYFEELGGIGDTHSGRSELDPSPGGGTIGLLTGICSLPVPIPMLSRFRLLCGVWHVYPSMPPAEMSSLAAMNNKAARPAARLLVSLVLLYGALWAESPRLCSVRGRVVNAAGDQPLRNARVQLKSTEDTLRSYDVTSDPGGRFAFTQVVPDTYRLVVRHNRFVPGAYGQKGAVFSSGSLLTLKPGDEVNDLLFRLVPTAAISGQLFDEDGEPLPGVEVQALVQSSHVPAAPDAPSVIQNLVPIQTAITNDLGEFRLHSLPPGEYYVSAVDSGMPAVNDQSLTGELDYELADTPRPEYPPSYYPGATNLWQASKVVVRSGDEVQIALGLRRGDMYAVSGRVLDASGHPLQGANVFVSPEELAAEFSSPRYGGETDSSGRFHITRVAAGN